MASSQPIPKTVIDKDHELDGKVRGSTEALTKFRWQQTLDPSGPRYSFGAYAKAVGRSDTTIRVQSTAYAAFVAEARNGNARSRSIAEHIELAHLSAERQELATTIAEAQGVTIDKVTRGDGRHAMHTIVGHARERAERRGTPLVDEVRHVAASAVRHREVAAAERETRRNARTFRYIEIDGHLAAAQRRLTQALQVAEGVGFSDEELELLRDSIGKVRAVLNLLDLRCAGTPDIDWDAELVKIGGDSNG